MARIFLILSFTILLFISGAFPVMAANSNSDIQFELKIEEASESEKEAFNDIINSFRLYSAFFNDTEQIGDFYIPVHAADRLTAVNYFTEGFSDMLAYDIVDSYTIWNQEIRKQVIIPSEGIPVLSKEDISKTTYSSADNNTIVFQCTFSNCYLPGDIYLYQISASYTDSKWKIDRLQFDAIYIPDTSQALHSEHPISPQ